jgi:acetyl-CoA acetyltransferase
VLANGRFDLRRARGLRDQPKAYEQAGIGPENVQVIELHDCFSANELITYEALGLAPLGKAGDLVNEGATTYGGQ